MGLEHQAKVNEVLRKYPKGSLVQSLSDRTIKYHVDTEIAWGSESGDIWLRSVERINNIKVWNKHTGEFAKIIKYPKGYFRFKLFKLFS